VSYSIADRSSRTRRRAAGSALLVATALLAGCAGRELPAVAEPAPAGTIERDTILREATGFFGRGAEGLAEVVNRVFRDRGDPSGYIKGEEGGGAFGIGLRYGSGTLYLSDGSASEIYWRGPSVGIDIGGSAAKTFILVYDLPTTDALYERFGGVEGSLFVVGGVGVNYNRSGETLLAPVRFGVGWRQGVSVGYLHLSRDRSWLPF
jgi:hypothetical protein